MQQPYFIPSVQNYSRTGTKTRTISKLLFRPSRFPVCRGCLVPSSSSSCSTTGGWFLLTASRTFLRPPSSQSMWGPGLQSSALSSSSSSPQQAAQSNTNASSRFGLSEDPSSSVAQPYQAIQCTRLHFPMWFYFGQFVIVCKDFIFRSLRRWFLEGHWTQEKDLQHRIDEASEATDWDRFQYIFLIFFAFSSKIYKGAVFKPVASMSGPKNSRLSTPYHYLDNLHVSYISCWDMEQ